jgi:4a-hydroxytetrahydrobiopterin dehydratase
MSGLETKHCVACEGGVQPLTPVEVNKLLLKIPHWEVNAEATMISRRFSFKNFHLTMAFVNAIAWMAHQEDHHPDLEVGYNYCNVKYYTHAIGGLSENDFICAAKVNMLLASK